MHPGVAAQLARSGGLITRVQALDLGVDPQTIRHLLASGAWVPVHRGVYADAEVWNALDAWRGRPLMRARAAVLTMRRSWAFSHDSAAHAHGLEMLAPEDPKVHITRSGHTNAWTKGRVKHHLARYRPEQLVTVDGYPALDIARTVADVSREHGVRHGLVVADSALRRGVTRGELWEAVDVMRHWSGVPACRAVIELADPGAQNAAETLGRELVLELGLGDVDTQWPLQLSNGRIAWCDIRVGCHVFEVHGLVKYLPPEQGGVADSLPARIAFNERKRERLVGAEGLGVSNLYWEDFWGRARQRAKQRARADWEETVTRFGTELPEHLVRNAREIRDRQRPPGAA